MGINTSILANSYSTDSEDGVLALIQTQQDDPEKINSPLFKEIKTGKIISLSPEEKKRVIELVNNLYEPSYQPVTPMSLVALPSLPSSVSLGMNGVPVLDQRQVGSCGVFAATAALDALYGKGDYISQLCYIEERPLCAEGVACDIRDIIPELKEKGVFSKKYEQQYGCEGWYQYPERGTSSSFPKMPEEEYKQHSEKIFEKLIINSMTYHPGDDVLAEVKQALFNKHRIVTALLLNAELTNEGAAGRYYPKKSTGIVSRLMDLLGDDSSFNTPPPNSWVLTDGMNINTGEWGAHYLVITGYDDNAVINSALRQKGVLTLRNSWGKNAGDNGDFYVSYDYFKAFGREMVEVSFPDLNPGDST